MTTISQALAGSAQHVGEALQIGFLRAAAQTPDRPALEVDGETSNYSRLRDSAARIAATLQRRTPDGGPALTAVFAHRSSTGFAGILGSLMAGNGYVPLNRTFPVVRTRRMLETAECRSMVVDERSASQLPMLLDDAPNPLLVLLPKVRDLTGLVANWPQHTFLGTDDLEPADAWLEAPPAPDAIAYLLFTSGSTGAPKGVMVTHANASHFVEMAARRYDVRGDDRFSQMFDATFDLSVFDMFVAWSRGACVCCPSEQALLNPDKFISEQRLTVWMSVPSVATFMKRFGVLRSHRYPSLRWSLFCGEALPMDVTRSWAEAASSSTVENLYGPTEATVACSAYRWNPERSPAESTLGIVPIGHPLPGMEALVVDDSLREVEVGDTGELLMTGPQVAKGYWRNPEATARSFVSIPGRTSRYYRTGDRVRRPQDGKPFTFVGRIDAQVKVLGHRVELGEVEAALRDQVGITAAAAIGWPRTSSGVGGVVGFVTGEAVDPEGVRAALKELLPKYAVPRAVHVLTDLPFTPNGKVDRRALTALLEEADRHGH